MNDPTPTHDGMPHANQLAADDLARRFHEAYERLAPEYGYETRKESAVAWEDVPEANRSLMVAVAAEVHAELVGLVGTLQQERDDYPPGTTRLEVALTEALREAEGRAEAAEAALAEMTERYEVSHRRVMDYAAELDRERAAQ